MNKEPKGNINKISTVKTGDKTISQKVRIDRFLASIQKSAYRMAHQATSNNDDALELVQESMLQLVKRYNDRPDNELRVLFYRILSSRITDWYRRTAFRRQFQAIFSKESYDDGDPVQSLTSEFQESIDEQHQKELQLETLQLALKKLSNRQQQTFLLRAWQGFDVKETAKILGCSISSVKTHYSRALATLKIEMGEDDE